MHKSWNVRDQTKEVLQEELEKKYKTIENEYKMLRKVSKKEDAEKLVDEIWAIKEFANEIELELLRREYNATSQEDERCKRSPNV